jgi:hypothetical protein
MYKYKFIQIQRFANQLFDDDKTANKASRIDGHTMSYRLD